ncbi:MAG: hypothetical protein IKZ34_03860 [Alphaproteobacteria bacterium]|nr:hypothetical protein [Alphaproteobacteria bacterium]
MPSKKKVMAAARRVRNTRKATANKKTGFCWKRVWNVLCWPCKQIAKILRSVWNWVCNINIIGLVNSTLLVSIIVLFSMLILDITKCNKAPVVIVADPVPVTKPVEKRKVVPRTIPVLPATSKKQNVEPVNVVPVKKAEVAIAKKQIAKQGEKFLGDVVIDSRAAGALLQNKTQINGNLYLQNMHKYTLPCDIKINGHLFLRDIGLLQFCGDFVVTGNIYVSPRSSFGPIPKTARVGGYVIL